MGKPEEALRQLEELIDEEGQRPLLMRRKNSLFA